MEPARQEDPVPTRRGSLQVAHVDGPVNVSGTQLPTSPRTGGNARGVPAAVPASFADVEARARRLLDWAREESAYVRSHDVSLFSPQDVAGRNWYADEALYELLPRLLSDVARLRLACGRGVLWDHTRRLGHESSEAVQAYCLLWQQTREGDWH